MLRSADPFGAYGPEMTVQSLLDDAAAKIEQGALPDDPDIQVSVRSTIGETSKNLGLYKTAEPHLRKVEAILLRRFSKTHPDTLHARSKIAEVLWRKAELPEAKQLIEPVLKAQRRILGQEHAATLFSANVPGSVCRGLGQFGRAENLHRETYEIRRRVLGDEHLDTLNQCTPIPTI